MPLRFYEDLTDHSRAEWERIGEDAPKQLYRSERVWLVSEGETPLFLAGVWGKEVTGELPLLWMLTFKALAARHVRQLGFAIETLKELYSEGVFIYFDTEVKRTRKFAEFFGFRRVSFDGLTARYEVH